MVELARERPLSFARRFSQAGKPRQVPWLFALPGVVLLFLFHIVPIAAGFYYSLTDWNGLGHARYVGTANYHAIFTDPVARKALWHTLELAAVFFVLVNVIGLLLALGLYRTLRARNILRTVFFLPIVMCPIAVAYIWKYILDQNGTLNTILGWLGLRSFERPWLGDPQWALWTALVVLLWQYSGLSMVIYLAGLHGIPDQLIEASAIDGAGAWMRFRRIVFPLLAPAFTIVSTLMLIFGLRVFDQIVALTGGGPVDASQTLATEVYQETFVNGRYGYGAALAGVLTVLITAVALAQLIVLRRRERRI
jgi:raffinose/stachyose/melibiose transport system permease protein